MTQQPIEANVVLTADTSQYDAAMSQSSANTTSLAQTVDTLGKKLDDLAKSASRKLTGFAVADVTAITAATTAYGAFEKQMESLNAQAAVLHRSVEQQNKTFDSYTKSVNSLRDTFGMATSEAAQLTQVITRMSDGTRSVSGLADTFARLGAVTGESTAGLADGLMQLGRTMGTQDRDIGRYANTLTNLAASTNTSAQGIIGFAQQIAPVGRMINMSQTDIMGVSQAFLKAGQDGFTAGNAFTRLVSDIAYAAETGSPDLAKYSNLIGVTVDQFKEMDKTEGILQIFESLNRQGPAAITTLNRMGLDGMRTIRSITAMSQQTGGLRAAIDQARTGDPEALARGSEAALDGLADQLKRIRSEMSMTAESFGSRFAGPAKMFLGVIDEITTAVRTLMQGPFGSMLAGVAAIAAPFAALTAAILGSAKAIGVFAGAMALLKNSGTQGFMEGRQGFGAIGRTQTMTPIGPQGARVADQGNWVGRTMYNYNQRLGAASRVAGQHYNQFMQNQAQMGSRVGGWWANRPSQVDPSTPGMFSRAMGVPFRVAGAGFRLIGDTYSPGQGVNLRAMEQGRAMESSGGIRGFWGRAWNQAPMDDPSNRVRIWNRQSLFDRNSVPEGATNQFQKLSKAMGDAEKRVTGFGAAVTGAGRNLGYMMTSMGAAGVGAGRMIGRAGSGIFNSALNAFGPWGLGIMGATAAYAGWQNFKDTSGTTNRDMSGSMDPYLQGAGSLGVTGADTVWRQAGNRAYSVQDALTIDQPDVEAALHSQYEVTQPKLKGMNIGEATAYLATQWDLVKDNATAVNSIKLDLINTLGGADAANQVLSNLNQGYEGESVDEFMASAMSQDRRWKGLRDPETGDVRSRIALAGGAVTDRANMAAMLYGTEAGRVERSRGEAEMFGEFLRANGGKGARAITLDMDQSEVKAMAEWMKDNGFGQSFDEEDLRRFANPEKFGSGYFPDSQSNEQMYRQFLTESYFAKGSGVSEQDRRNFLANRGIDPDLVDKPGEAVNAVMSYVGGDYSEIATMDPNSLASRLGRVSGAQTRYGKGLFETWEVSEAMANEGDMNKQIEGINSMLRALKEAGNSPLEIERILGDMRATAEEGREYDFLVNAQAMNQRHLGYQMADLNVTDRFVVGNQLYRQRMAIAEGDPQEMQLKEQAEEERFQNEQATKQYFIGLLTAQREFNISQARAQQDFAIQRERMDYQYNLQRERAEDDFALQRQHALEDFHTQRSRAEEDFKRQSERSSEDFFRSLRRQRADYNLSRQRQEEDFNHQVELMTERAAQSVYNIYDRIQVQRTSSAGWLLHNTRDQLEEMEEQTQNLNRLRRMGVSDDVIQQMGLTDAKNAQQLERFVGDLADNPKLVRQFNRQIQQRLGAARRLVTDESSQDWQEFTRQHRLSRRRGAEDFEKGVARSREDFTRNMRRMEDDFRRSMRRSGDDFWKQMARNSEQFDLSMDRMAEDYATSTDQMTQDFDRQMRRAAKDLDRMANQITGSMEEILRKSVKKLSGHAKEQARTVRTEFRGFEDDTTAIATRIMERITDIFGVKWQAPPAPKAAHNPNRGGERDAIPGGAWAGGGVLPGWSPGYDNMTFRGPAGELKLSGGEAIMRPEWTRAVGGPKIIEKWNHEAKHGKAFASGGVVPAPGAWNQHTSGYPWARWSGDINIPGTSDLGNPVKAWKDGVVADVQRWNYSYGNHVKINHPGSDEQTLYAHLSKITVAVGDAIRAGQKLGEVGSTGRTSGPHLHFEIKGGTGPINMGSAGSGQSVSVDDLLLDEYPRLERSAGMMSSVHPFKPGQASRMINRLARRALRKFDRKGLIEFDEGHVQSPDAPGNVSGNVALGKRMAANWGWTGDQWDALYNLWKGESNWDHQADNPTSSAYGIPQALVDYPGRSMPQNYFATRSGYGKHADFRGGDPAVQIRWGLGYIKDAYGSPSSAWSAWNSRSPHWYGDGAVFAARGAETIGVGERGGEVVLPLDRGGVDFLGALMKRLNPGLESKGTNVSGFQMPVGTQHNYYSYQIDRSSNFHGAITVQAQDPNEFVAKLRQRERTRALTQPAIGGARV